MSSNAKLLLAVFLASVIGMGAGYLLHKYTQKPPDIRIAAEEKVEFTLPDTRGEQRQLSDWYDQKLILLNFWATWCQPCREETPLFVEAQKRYAKTGLQVIGLAVDEKQHVEQFMQDFGINYPVLLGIDEGIGLMESLGNHIGALPFSVFLDPDGHVLAVKLGEFSASELDSQIQHFLFSVEN